MQHYDDSLSRVEQFTPTYLLLPYQEDMSFTVYGAVPSKNPFVSQYASRVSYDAFSGQWQSSLDICQESVGGQFIDSFRALHFGNFAGLTSKIIWSVLGVMPVLLGGASLYMRWKRRPKRAR